MAHLIIIRGGAPIPIPVSVTDTPWCIGNKTGVEYSTHTCKNTCRCHDTKTSINTTTTIPVWCFGHRTRVEYSTRTCKNTCRYHHTDTSNNTTITKPVSGIGTNTGLEYSTPTLKIHANATTPIPVSLPRYRHQSSSSLL